MNPWKKARDEVGRLVSDAFKKLGWPFPGEITIERPAREFGDLAVPCHQFSRALGTHPQKISEALQATIESGYRYIDKADARGPYINFFFDNIRFCSDVVREAVEKKEKWGSGDKKNIKLIVEHTSANPTGPLHIGRARNPIIGDTIARILRFAGYDVETQYYVNDMGRQAAMLYYGYRKYAHANEGGKYDREIVRCYQRAAKEGDEDGINEVLRNYENFESKTHSDMRNVIEKVMEGIKESLRRIDIFIDRFVWESDFVKDGSAGSLLKKLSECGEIKEDDGALYIEIDGEKIFLTRKDGTTLYVLRDVAYHIYKMSQCDIAINILGEDHKFESEVICKILKMLGYDRCPEVIFYSFVSLPEGKMSTREGRTVYLDDLVQESIARAYEEVKKRRGDLPREKMEKIAEAVGTGAVRYNIIGVQAEKPITFRWEESLNFEGNSAPYIQYAHARCCSILRRAGGFSTGKFEHLNGYEIDLIKEIGIFPDIVERCAEQRKSHILPSYLQKLVETFNQFYIHVPVLRAESEDIRNARLNIVDAMKWTLRNALMLLGIKSPEEM